MTKRKSVIEYMMLRKIHTFNNNLFGLKRQNGAALLFFIFLILVMSVLAGYLVELNTTSTLGELSYNHMERAYFMAEAGGHYAVKLVKQDIETDTAYDDTYLIHNQTFILDDGGGNEDGRFRIVVDDSDVDMTLVHSIGTINTDVSSGVEVKLSYSLAKTATGSSVFVRSLFTGNEISIENQAKITGDVGTNDTTISKGSGVTITGDEETSVGMSLDLINFSCGACTNDKEISGNETWFSGTYEYYNVLIKEKKTLTINGDVTLYVKEDFIAEEKSKIKLLSNSSLTVYVDKKIEFRERFSVIFQASPDRAEDVVIYGTSNADTVTMGVMSKFTGAIYAPNADILIEEKSHITGSIVGDTIKIEEKAKIAYDPDVINISTPVGGGGVTFDAADQFFSQ